MMLPRRTFLLGLAAAFAAPAFQAALPFLEPVSPATIPRFLKWRAIGDLLFSCMPTGDEIRSPDFREEPVRYRFMRDGDVLLDVMLNPRASYRWVATQDSEFVITEHSLFGVQIEPAHTLATLSVISDIEKDHNPAVRRRKFSECYEWKDGKLVLQSVAAMDVQDAYLLEASPR